MKRFLCLVILLIPFMILSTIILLAIKMVAKYGYTEAMIIMVDATIPSLVPAYWYEIVPVAAALEFVYLFTIQGIYTTRGEQPLDQI